MDLNVKIIRQRKAASASDKDASLFLQLAILKGCEASLLNICLRFAGVCVCVCVTESDTICNVNVKRKSAPIHPKVTAFVESYNENGRCWARFASGKKGVTP